MEKVSSREKERKRYDEIRKKYELSAYWKYEEDKKEWIENTLKEEADSSPFKIIVLDDDPTGVQSVHHISVFTDWSKESIERGFLSNNKLFFILTNSRGATEEETKKLHKEIAGNVTGVSATLGIPFIIMNRSDSTLRGHFPLETEVLKEELEKEEKEEIDGEIIIPFFEAGGRLTIDNIHYVKYENELIPAGETEFAKDKTFAYEHSDLRLYIEEKTKGAYPAKDVTAISIDDLRGLKINEIEEKLMQVERFQKVVVNALEQEELKVFAIALYKAIKNGKRFLFRIAADFVKIFANISSQPLLTGNEMVKKHSTYGGMVVIGSHTKKTTAQLEYLKNVKGLVFLEMNTDLVLEGKLNEEVSQIISQCESLIRNGETPVVYTKRTLLTLEGDTGEEALLRSVSISDAVQKVVGELRAEPSFIIAKGGITSSDVGVKALKVKEAVVLGQAQPGIPVWRTDEDSKFPGIPYIIFPGNVGEEDTLKKVVTTILKEKENTI